jgi:hypothetical protein
VLVGQKQNALAARKGPLEGGSRIRRRAHQPAALAAKGFDRGSRVHVRQRDRFPGQTQPLERIPAGFHLRDFGHIGHRTAGIQVGQDYLLARVAEHVGTFGHEVNAAEKDVPRIGFCGDLRELVAVAGRVGEADHFVALVVVAEQRWPSSPASRALR